MATLPGLAVAPSARSGLDWGAVFKDAALAAVVAALLALPLVGLQTYDVGGGGLGIRTRLTGSRSALWRSLSADLSW
jgi:hypothetical protein